jgi:branched-chain amino acid transport system substrate-binding protein
VDAPARPQFWQLHGDKGVGMNFIAFYAPKSELSDVGKEFAKRYQAKFNEAPVYAALNGFANALIFAAAIEKAKTTEPKAMIKALEEGSFTGWSTVPVTFPRAEGALWHNWSPPLLVLHYTAKDQTPATAEGGLRSRALTAAARAGAMRGLCARAPGTTHNISAHTRECPW